MAAFSMESLMIDALPVVFCREMKRSRSVAVRRDQHIRTMLQGM